MPGIFDSLLGVAQAAPATEDEQIKHLYAALTQSQQPSLVQSLADGLAGILPVIAASGVAGGRYGDIGAQYGQRAMDSLQQQRNSEAEQRRKALLVQLGGIQDERKESRMSAAQEAALRRQEAKDDYQRSRDEVKDAQWQKQFQLSQAKMDAMNEANSAHGKPLTPGQKAADVAFGKDYAEWSAGGGYQAVQNDIQKLKSDVLAQLNPKDTSSNPLAGALARSNLIGSAIVPKRVALQDNIASVIQKNLRKTLGAQFTEREGELLIQRAFNPQLSDAENFKRVNLVLDQLDALAREKEAATKAFESSGTLSEGYKSGSTGLSPEEARELEELRRLKSGK